MKCVPPSSDRHPTCRSLERTTSATVLYIYERTAIARLEYSVRSFEGRQSKLSHSAIIDLRCNNEDSFFSRETG